MQHTIQYTIITSYHHLLSGINVTVPNYGLLIQQGIYTHHYDYLSVKQCIMSSSAPLLTEHLTYMYRTPFLLLPPLMCINTPLGSSERGPLTVIYSISPHLYLPPSFYYTVYTGSSERGPLTVIYSIDWGTVTPEIFQRLLLAGTITHMETLIIYYNICIDTYPSRQRFSNDYSSQVIP